MNRHTQISNADTTGVVSPISAAFPGWLGKAVQLAHLSLHTRTDVAIEAADVTLISGALEGVVTSVGLSRSTMRNIRQNLFLAFVYNILGIPVAAGALYATTGLLLNPMIAAGAMALSSLSVVTNANRLRGFRAAALPEEGETTDRVSVEVHEDEGRPKDQKEEAMTTVKDPVCGMEIDPQRRRQVRSTRERRTTSAPRAAISSSCQRPSGSPPEGSVCRAGDRSGLTSAGVWPSDCVDG